MNRMNRQTTRAVALVLASMLCACSDTARDDLVDVGEALGRAGEALDAAIRQTAEDAEPHAKEAGREVMESFADAKAKLKAAGAAIDDDPATTPGDEQKLDPDAITCMDERYAVSREVAERVADAPMALALEAGVEETDRGTRVTEVQPGGILARLGLREGDVIVGVSGLDLEGPMDRPLHERLESDEVTVAIERAGKRIDKRISIAEEEVAPGS
jgi:hypothetical protein